MSLGWTLSGSAAFDGFRFEWPALTALAVKPGQVPLAISCVRIVRLMIGFTLRYSLLSFIEITDLYIVHDSICPLTLAHMVSTIVSEYAGVVVGLLSVRLFSTRHISLVPFAYGTLRCQIPRYASVIGLDTSSFRLLCATVLVPSL